MARAGEVFEPGMGFLLRRDYLSGNGTLGYGWRPAAGSGLNSYSVNAAGSVVERNADSSVESASYGFRGQLETRRGQSVIADVTRNYEDLRFPFVLSTDAQVPVGSYWFTEGSVSYMPPAGSLFRPNLNAGAGQFYDGTRVSVGFSPTWSVSRHLALSGTYSLNRIEFDERNQVFTSHVVRLRTDFTFTTATSASAFVQYNSAGDVVGWNVRFRYNPTEGTDLYLVWNETLNSDRFALSPVAPLSQERTLLVKYSRTFTLGL